MTSAYGTSVPHWNGSAVCITNHMADWLKCQLTSTKELFEGCAETEEEANDIYPVTTDVFNKLHTVFKIWSHCLAIDNESVFAGEFAYAYEFVMKNDNMPDVQFSSKNSLYPDNYPGYNASEHRWFHHNFLDHLADAD